MNGSEQIERAMRLPASLCVVVAPWITMRPHRHSWNMAYRLRWNKPKKPGDRGKQGESNQASYTGAERTGAALCSEWWAVMAAALGLGGAASR